MSCQLGFKATPANLLSVPVYAWACIVTVAVGFLGDRIGHRALINLYVGFQKKPTLKYSYPLSVFCLDRVRLRLGSTGPTFLVLTF